MRFPGTLSARILFAFAVLIVTFGSISVLTIANMDRLDREIRVIRVGYLQLALKTKDLAEKQSALLDYLRDELEGESTARRVDARVRRFLVSRQRLIEQTDQVLKEVRDLPEIHRKTMEASAGRLAEIRKLVLATDANYRAMLAAPPVERALAAAGKPDDKESVETAVTALKKLRRDESRIHNKTQELQGYQRGLVERTALNLERGSRKLRLLTILFGAAAVVIGLIVTVLATLALRPLRRLRVAAQRIAQGDYAGRIEVKGPREVADLAREFNVMGQAVEERERELVRTERLAAVGKMAAMITHEVRNPLSSIGLNTELLEEELGAVPEEQATEARSLCRSIHTEVDRLTDITEEYLQFARLPKPKLQEEQINPIVQNLIDFEREQLALRGVTIELELSDDLPVVVVDDAQVRQALLNLLRNAADSIEETGSGTVQLRTSKGRDGIVEVQVADDGPGIAAGQANKLFDPFFSTKVGGTGLGLALTHQIIREHGGTIRVESKPGQGATFIVELPTANPSAV
jgi:signal transduction histidine kinase